MVFPVDEVCFVFGFDCGDLGDGEAAYDASTHLETVNAGCLISF